MTIDPHSLRAMAEELTALRKEAAPADRRLLRALQETGTTSLPAMGPYRGTQMAQMVERAQRPGVGTQVAGGIERMGQGMEGLAEKAVSKIRGGLGRLRGAAGQVAEGAGGHAAEGAKKRLMTMGGSPNTQMRQFGREMGSEAAEGALRRLRPSGKMMAGAGLGALALGGLAAFAQHRRKQQRQKDMANAVAAGIRQAQGQG